MNSIDSKKFDDNAKSDQNAFYDKLIETQILQNYLNAKIFPDSEVDQMVVNMNDSNSKFKFSQNTNLINQQQSSAVSLPFNVVMSNLAALAGARNIFSMPQTQKPIINNNLVNSAGSVTDPQQLLNQKYLTGFKNLHYSSSKPTLFQQNEENCEYMRKKLLSPPESDHMKKESNDS